MHETDRAGGGLESHAPQYVVVHLVAQEIHKGLIESQVVDHMVYQATTPGSWRPSLVAVAFLEPARNVLRLATRRRARHLARRAPELRIRLWPFVGRLGVRLNAWMLALRVRKLARGLPVVLHCRAESAVAWAVAMRRWIPDAAIIADMRGVWPEEMLHMRGIDDPSKADPTWCRAYDGALADVRRALNEADGILAVSEPLRRWLATQDPKALSAQVVPCCVARVTYDEATRRQRRFALGVDEKLVLAYLGGVASYQHVGDGFLAFAREAVRKLGQNRVHVLCITQDARQMQELVSAASIPSFAVTILALPQQVVADFLCAADIGFLLRDDSLVNRVSVPVKLSEYLASGVPVVVSRMDGFVSDIIDRNGAGVVVEWFDTGRPLRSHQVKRVLETFSVRQHVLRQGALELCSQHFVWSAHLQQVRQVYVQALHAVSRRTA